MLCNAAKFPGQQLILMAAFLGCVKGGPAHGAEPDIVEPYLIIETDGMPVCVLFYPDGSKLLTTTSSGGELWNLNSVSPDPSGKEMRPGLEGRISLENNVFQCSALSPHREDTAATFSRVSSSNEIISGSVSLWSLTTPAPNASSETPLFDSLFPSFIVSTATPATFDPVMFHPEKNWLLASANNATIWDLDQGNARNILNYLSSALDARFGGSVAGSEYMAKVITSHADNTTVLWGLKDATAEAPSVTPVNNTVPAERKKRQSPLNPTITPRILAIMFHDENVKYSVYPAGSNEVLIVGGVTAKLWNLENVENTSEAKLIALLQHDADVTHADISPDGKIIATASGRDVLLWDRQFTVNQPKGPVLGLKARITHAGKVNYLLFTQSEQRLITASDDDSAKIWALDDLEKANEDGLVLTPGLLASLESEADVSGLVLSADETMLATLSEGVADESSDKGRVRIWRVGKYTGNYSGSVKQTAANFITLGLAGLAMLLSGSQ